VKGRVSPRQSWFRQSSDHRNHNR